MRNETQIHQPCDLFILPLARFYLQTLVVHLMDITCSLHVAKDVVLQVTHALEGIRHILVLLNVADDFSGFSTFSKIDQVGLADNAGDAIFDESEIREVDA